jgi:hypothetical protein
MRPCSVLSHNLGPERDGYRSVWTNYRLKLSGPCEMDLTGFPFDTVACHLTFNSFNYNTEEVQMSWSPVGVSLMREKMELADYELIGTPFSYRNEVVRLCPCDRR